MIRRSDTWLVGCGHDAATMGAVRRSAPPDSAPYAGGGALIKIDPSRVSTERHREAGPVHVGHQFWQRLDLDRILCDCKLSRAVRRLACAMTLNRLIAPSSEHAMPDWIRRTALADILGVDFDQAASASRRHRGGAGSRASAACSTSIQRSISTISRRLTSKASVPATPKPSAATRAIIDRIANRSWWVNREGLSDHP